MTSRGWKQNTWQLHVITHLHNKTNKEVENSQSDKQQFEVHVGDVVQLEHPAKERPGVQHQPGHHSEVDDQQTEEDHWRDESMITFIRTQVKNPSVSCISAE